MNHKNTLFQKNLTLNLQGKIFDLSSPVVMGIINLTPDSFFAHSRVSNEQEILNKVSQMLKEGACLIDIGAYSSRPNAQDISPEEEIKRLLPALQLLVNEFPKVPISVDTFRPQVAQVAIDYGAAMINDIYGGGNDEAMFSLVAKHQIPYLMMHCKGTAQTMQQQTQYEELVPEIFAYFQQKITRLANLKHHDIIVDLGFGFAKTLEQNYELLQKLEQFNALKKPLLVGISRKSMIYKLLEIDSENSLNGTSVLNTIALLKGANILRVHDVKPAVECIKLVQQLNNK